MGRNATNFGGVGRVPSQGSPPNHWFGGPPGPRWHMAISGESEGAGKGGIVSYPSAHHEETEHNREACRDETDWEHS